MAAPLDREPAPARSRHVAAAWFPAVLLVALTWGCSGHEAVALREGSAEPGPTAPDGLSLLFSSTRDNEANGVEIRSESAVKPLAGIGVRGQIFVTHSDLSRGFDAISFSREGRRGPITVLGAGRLVQIERVYDASHREAYHDAACYAPGYQDEAESVAGGERVLRVPELYVRFASFRLVNGIFREYSDRMKESRST